MLVRSQKVRKEVPHEPGCWMEFRGLSYAEAQEEQRAAMDGVLEMAGKLTEEMLARFAGQKAEGGKEADPLATRHVPSLLKGVLAWGGGDYDGAEVEPDALGQLDATTAKWAALEVLALTERPTKSGSGSGEG